MTKEKEMLVVGITGGACGSCISRRTGTIEGVDAINTGPMYTRRRSAVIYQTATVGTSVAGVAETGKLSI